jgi:3-oxoacyl-[acyl-carrier-protein] synthase-3
MAFPSTACHVQRLLGARKAAAFDVAASCSGFLYGLSMADAFIRSGRFRCCLVVAGEIKSRSLDATDESTAILFGDGAGAAVLVADEARGHASGILAVRVGADGARHGLIGIAAGGSRRPGSPQTIAEGDHRLRMRGGPLYRLAVRRLATAAQDVCKEFGLTTDDVQIAVFHQATGRLLESVAERLRLAREKLYTVIERFGNTSSASLPIALDYAVRERRISTGDLMLLGAFGGGLTWGTALVRW